MSLRAFHIVFIVVSVMLSLYVGVWGVRQYRIEGTTGALAFGVIFLLAAVALVIYGMNVVRKFRELP
ncbi:MAG: hypothetical protein JO197_23220 [Acidobacteria bacterium]|nr:hypothetical protein [Acidobacteriota bacterium]MBV9477881.1 hypothetical protein [Acidobacteriota bacterium]